MFLASNGLQSNKLPALVNFSPRYGRAGFVLLWMLNYIGMLSV